MRKSFRVWMAAGICGLLALPFVLVPVPATAKPLHFCQVDTAMGAFSASASFGKATSDPPQGIVLLVIGAKVTSGTPVFARLANFGRKRASYGREFAIERRTASGWKLDPASPKGPWIKVASVLKPGAAGRCYRFNVPAEQPAGWYRFTTKVSPEIGRAPQRRTAIFQIR